ncbi:hypothetical protein Syun_030428 [Stephania yunnanensis]|uniref:Uncharacterized protein n=1 Tax=Stephania yunnanensis TaxID=152371 RepID=A0AAP0HI86_9MAGN
MSVSLTAEAGSLETKKKASNSNFGPFSRTKTSNVPPQTHFTSHFHLKPAQSPLPKFVIFLLSTAAKAREPICSGSRSELIEVKYKA